MRCNCFKLSLFPRRFVLVCGSLLFVDASEKMNVDFDEDGISEVILDLMEVEDVSSGRFLGGILKKPRNVDCCVPVLVLVLVFAVLGTMFSFSPTSNRLDRDESGDV